MRSSISVTITNLLMEDMGYAGHEEERWNIGN